MFFMNSSLLLNTRKVNKKISILSIYQRLKYSTKTIQFKTCGQLFDKLREKEPKLYGKSPSNGLTVDIQYVDTFGDNISTNECKTIVAIHGIPGYHKHFNELIDYFEKRKVRVIVPNLADFSLTRQTMSFWHSTEERAQLIRDFLKALNVNKIDCLICHSAGVHPISLLWSHPQELDIKSIALFCPQPLWLSKYYYLISKPFSKLAQSRVGIKIVDALKPHLIANKSGYSMSYANVDEFLLTVTLPLFAESEKLHQRLQELKNKKIPTLVVYGEKDKLVLKNNFNKLLQDLGVNQLDLNYFSADGTIEKTITNEDWIKVLIFRNGGHLAYAKYSDIVNNQVNQLLSHS